MRRALTQWVDSVEGQEAGVYKDFLEKMGGQLRNQGQMIELSLANRLPR